MMSLKERKPGGYGFWRGHWILALIALAGSIGFGLVAQWLSAVACGLIACLFAFLAHTFRTFDREWDKTAGLVNNTPSKEAQG